MFAGWRSDGASIRAGGKAQLSDLSAEVIEFRIQVGDGDEGTIGAGHFCVYLANNGGGQVGQCAFEVLNTGVKGGLAGLVGGFNFGVSMSMAF